MAQSKKTAGTLYTVQQSETATYGISARGIIFHGKHQLLDLSEAFMALDQEFPQSFV
jgi:hypothetical protein